MALEAFDSYIATIFFFKSSQAQVLQPIPLLKADLEGLRNIYTYTISP